MWRRLASGAVALFFAATAGAAELRVYSPGAVRGVVTALAQSYEKTGGAAVRFEYGTAGAVAKRIGSGEPGDVAISTRANMVKLESQGRIVAGSLRDLGKVGVAVAARRGAPLPDISTPEAFKRAMLAAKSVMYADPALGGQSGIHTARVFEKLGIADAMKPKTMLRPGAPQGLIEVAKGDIEIGIGQMSEIVAAKGVQLVGPLPGELQNTLTFTAGVVAGTGDATAAAAFIEYLRSPAAREKFKASGFDLP